MRDASRDTGVTTLAVRSHRGTLADRGDAPAGRRVWSGDWRSLQNCWAVVQRRPVGSTPMRLRHERSHALGPK